MSPQARALVIGMLGPLLQAAGLVWDLLAHGVFSDIDQSDLTLRHILMDPAHLVVFVGLMISAVCIPVAIQVALTQPEDLELPLFERQGAGQPADLPAGTLETAD